MRIGELADRAGVSVRALRYYEEQGLLYSERSSSGQRHYPEPAVERVQLIQLLYSAGLSSRTIAELLPCVDAKVSTPESRARLAAERERIDGQITELIRARDRLDAVIAFSGTPASGCTYQEVEDYADALASAGSGHREGSR
ncbi:MerR family transcriptional regulator [Actinoplanes sp. LDG1-06]|uniref:MerR family transcriptional regulator n=1 Tax=Paractinoplanes ovalisporus TaxID=2810368 RepID=A0ABS2ALC7_9ACTN|nr:MerR family transcriptional regulator [Actinoplanes ovalisporus]MBM2620669.1 MerR family transcriptional regulator [Actinoplanes ovalisporus]